MFDFCYYGVFKLGRLIKKPFSLAYKVWEERVLMKLFQSELEDYIIAKNIDVIHAHTPYRVGIPAQKAAKKLEKNSSTRCVVYGKKQLLLMEDGREMV